MTDLAIESVPQLAPSVESGSAFPTTRIGQPGFAEWLVGEATHVDRALAGAENAVADFALNGSAPPHQVVMALEEARMSLQFALQVRSRLVEGYQELMRMQL
ncbi:flagellar hook-basal body complex protein FliE [Burkholderia ambifaria]|uniref:flagellar hook-basal body complex protein FliE n=1 Tax=Burkholderia ambifaria TaxID=152480 RepID=UPI00158F0D02|nr:flagellar hook-basal body complex protein FliE [Burkholderia ambifaria]